MTSQPQKKSQEANGNIKLKKSCVANSNEGSLNRLNSNKVPALINANKERIRSKQPSSDFDLTDVQGKEQN